MKRYDIVQIFGEWRDGPWMAVRRAKVGPRRNRWVIELKVPGDRYEFIYFHTKLQRDLWAAWIVRSPRWRRSARYAELLRANRRAYR